MASVAHNNLNAKLVLLGDMGAGKSSLVIRFVKGQFLEFQESTIGAAFFSQSVSVNNATVKFEIWDTAGQERYYSLAPMYYRGAAAAIIVYDITTTDSFARAKKWVQELQKQGNPNMIMALAGNKCDLEEKRNVPTEQRGYLELNPTKTQLEWFWLIGLLKDPELHVVPLKHCPSIKCCAVHCNIQQVVSFYLLIKVGFLRTMQPSVCYTDLVWSWYDLPVI